MRRQALCSGFIWMEDGCGDSVGEVSKEADMEPRERRVMSGMIGGEDVSRHEVKVRRGSVILRMSGLWMNWSGWGIGKV